MKPLVALIGSLAIAASAGLFGLVSKADPSARSAPPEGAELYFIAPQDEATVTSPLVVRFGLKGMGVAPAGVMREHNRRSTNERRLAHGPQVD